jgi:O-antigen/teichoic acid export membrane protein
MSHLGPTSRLRYRLAGYSAAATVFERGVASVGSIVRVRILIDAVGASGYGSWLAVLGFAQSGRMLNGGTHLALINRFAEASLDESGRAVRMVSATAFYLYLGIAVVGTSIGCGLVAAAPLSAWLGPAYGGPGTQRLLALCIVWVFASMPLNVFGLLLVGTQRQYLLSIWGAGTTAVQIVLLVVAVRGGWHSMTQLGLVIAGTDLVAAGGLAVVVALHEGFIPSLRDFDRTALSGLFIDGFYFAAADVGNWLKFTLPPLLLAASATPARLAEFAIAMQLFQTCLGFIALIGRSLWPAYAQSASAGDRLWLAAAFSRASAVSVLCAGLSGGLLLLFGGFIVRVWLHGSIGWSPQVAVALSVWIVGQSMVQGTAIFLAGISRTKSMAGINFGEGAVALLGSMIMVRWFGATGIAAAIAFAACGSALMMTIAARSIVPQMPVRLSARSTAVAIGTVLAVSLLTLSWGDRAVVAAGIPTAAAVGGLLTALYVSLAWYGVATSDHRRRAKSLMLRASR